MAEKLTPFVRVLDLERQMLRCVDRETWFDLKHKYMEAYDEMERDAEAKEIIADLQKPEQARTAA